MPLPSPDQEGIMASDVERNEATRAVGSFHSDSLIVDSHGIEGDNRLIIDMMSRRCQTVMDSERAPAECATLIGRWGIIAIHAADPPEYRNLLNLFDIIHVPHRFTMTDDMARAWLSALVDKAEVEGRADDSALHNFIKLLTHPIFASYQEDTPINRVESAARQFMDSKQYHQAVVLLKEGPIDETDLDTALMLCRCLVRQADEQDAVDAMSRSSASGVKWTASSLRQIVDEATDAEMNRLKGKCIDVMISFNDDWESGLCDNELHRFALTHVIHAVRNSKTEHDSQIHGTRLDNVVKWYEAEFGKVSRYLNRVPITFERAGWRFEEFEWVVEQLHEVCQDPTFPVSNEVHLSLNRAIGNLVDHCESFGIELPVTLRHMLIKSKVNDLTLLAKLEQAREMGAEHDAAMLQLIEKADLCDEALKQASDSFDPAIDTHTLKLSVTVVRVEAMLRLGQWAKVCDMIGHEAEHLGPPDAYLPVARLTARYGLPLDISLDAIQKYSKHVCQEAQTMRRYAAGQLGRCLRYLLEQLACMPEYPYRLGRSMHCLRGGLMPILEAWDRLQPLNDDPWDPQDLHYFQRVAREAAKEAIRATPVFRTRFYGYDCEAGDLPWISKMLLQHLPHLSDAEKRTEEFELRGIIDVIEAQRRKRRRGEDSEDADETE